MPVPSEYRTTLGRDEIATLVATGKVRLFLVGNRFRIVRAGLRAPDDRYEVGFERWYDALEKYRVGGSSMPGDSGPHLTVYGDRRDESFACVGWSPAGARAYRNLVAWERRTTGTSRRRTRT